MTKLWEETIEPYGPDRLESKETAIGDSNFANRLDVPALLSKPNNSAASKQGEKNFKAGVTSEKRVSLIFEGDKTHEGMGFFGVTKLKTGYNPYKKYSQKTAADFSAVQCVTGLGVLIEAKNITNGRLIHSRVKEHQRDNLTLWRDNNALAYLAITSKIKGRLLTAVLAWPVPGFVAGTSIKWEDAWAMRMNR